MSNSALKLLAQKAKNRLKTASNNLEAMPSIKRAGLTSREYAIIATRVKVEDDPIYNKVIKILTKDPDTYRPLGELIEHDIYDNLPESDKQKYILNLSSRFKAIKQKFNSINPTPEPAMN